MTSGPALVAIACLASYSLLVSLTGMSVAYTLAGLPLAIALAYIIARVRVGMPPTIKGNRLPARYGDRRYQLVAMPVNHFGERLRWCMDLIGAPYEESSVGGLLSILARGRTVPWLVDRQSCSRIGNSDEALWYLAGVHVPMMVGPGQALAAALLRRDAVSITWERRLNDLGHAIQGWAYFYLLAPRADPELSLRMWGGRDPSVPRVERWVVVFGHRLLVASMRNAFKLHDLELHESRRRIIDKLLDEADDALEHGGGPYLLGPELSCIDIGFCSLLGLLMPHGVIEHWARGRFASFHALSTARWPEELVTFEAQLRARPCGQFIQWMFERWRHVGFAGDGASQI